MKQTLLLVALLALCWAQQESFTANVIISKKPGVSGSLTAAIAYHYGPPQNQVMRINYAIGPVEYFNYTARLRSISCSPSCDTESHLLPMPILFAQASDTLPGVTVGGCTQRNKPASSGVTSIFVNAAGNICRAIFTDGTVFDFSGWGAAAALSSFVPPAVCPKPVCTKRIDFELIFDESGSIDPPDFTLMKDFAASIARSFTWGFDYVGMGLAMFADGSRQVQTLTFSQSTFLQKVNGVQQSEGSTCIGCGIQSAYNDIVARGRKIPGTNTPVTRVFIVLTDGKNNVGDFRPITTTAKDAGIIFFAIGVGAGVDTTEIETIGSDIAGVQTVFYGNAFAELPTILNGLVTATCVDVPGNPCGAGCRGFCACGGVCLCPDLCDDGNFCTDDICKAGVAGNGCNYTPHSCNDNNACTTDTCEATGCRNANITCFDNDLCTTDTCDPAIGCLYPTRDCADNSPCTTDSCVPGSGAGAGCRNVLINNCPQVCSDPQRPITCPALACRINECDPLRNGNCTSRPRTCADTNPCTIDGCDVSTDKCTFTLKNCSDGNACTVDSCNPATGACINTPINASEVCNDFNACTIDTCNTQTGCVNTIRSCADGDICTDEKCNSVIGCYNPPVDCWVSDPDLKGRPNLIGCFAAVCVPNTTRGCQLSVINGSAAAGECRVCVGGINCNANLDSGAVTGLSVGIIVGIVLGIVALFAILGIIGGKKGYDVWLKHRTNMQGANTNPLYSDNGLSGTNPMYAQE